MVGVGPSELEPGPARLGDVFAEREAVVVEIRPWDVHGVAHVDVTLVYADRSVETARLGRESVPDGLVAGEHVLVAKAMNVVVELRRPDP